MLQFVWMELYLVIISIRVLDQVPTAGSFNWRCVDGFPRWINFLSLSLHWIQAFRFKMGRTFSQSWKFYMGRKKEKKSELLELKSVTTLNWVSWLQGGGWCNNIKSCVFRKTTRRGSSKYMEKTLAFTGILSNKAEENPGPDSNYWFPFQQWLCLLLLLYILLRFYSWSFSPLWCRFFQLEQSWT